MFAKLFEDTRYGQILVKKDSAEDGSPEVRYFFETEGLNICSAAIGMTDSDNGWKAAGDVFGSATVETAEKFVENVFESLGL